MLFSPGWTRAKRSDPPGLTAARAFGALLEDEALDAGAEQVSANIASEELSKSIVDTEARLAARTELRDRLLQVLKTRRGTVEELVEAERSVAQVNEEIDQARSWLKEMQGRVAYSKVTVNYETGTPVTGDFLAPVAGALGSLGTIFGYMLAILIIVGAVALPIGGMVWASRALGRRMAPPAGSPMDRGRSSISDARSTVRPSGRSPARLTGGGRSHACA